MKTRAPRNRTLQLTEDEAQSYSERLSVFPKRGLSTEEIRNRIFQGDFEKSVSFLPDASIDLLIIDPPYNLSKTYGDLRFKETDEETYETWLRGWFRPLLSKLKKTASVYVCCDWKSSLSIQRVLREELFVRNRITWEREKGRGAKENWKNCLEDIWYATRSEDFTFDLDAVKLKRRVLAPYRNSEKDPKDWEETPEGGFRLTSPSNLWTDLTVPFWSMPENTDHPTQKPEKLIAKLILASSRPGDLVFDPFLGSGTTAVVAKKLGRTFSGVELNPEYAAWALKRLDQAEIDSRIQGYEDGVFWERNSGP